MTFKFDFSSWSTQKLEEYAKEIEWGDDYFSTQPHKKAMYWAIQSEISRRRHEVKTNPGDDNLTSV